MLNGTVKDPSAVLDYAIDWLGYLSGVTPPLTIASSTWVVSPVETGGLAMSSEAVEGSKTSLRLSAGIVGHTYRVTNRITVAGGLTDERSFLVRVENR